MSCNVCSTSGCEFVLFEGHNDVLALCTNGAGVLHQRLATSGVVRCPSEGATVQESCG